MPTPTIRPTEQHAYNIAVNRIEECKQRGAADTKLDLSGLGLKVLPPQICALTALRTLDARFNQLTVLPSEIINLKLLMTLDISHNHLTTFPLEITNLHSLTTLHIAGNQFTILPQEIVALLQLTVLNLRFNELTSLPQSFKDLKSLTELDLSHNKLVTLPDPVTGLSSLVSLDLSKNLLTSLPKEISNLRSLKTFHLFGNQLTTLPQEIVALPLLTTLDLRGNLTLGKVPGISNSLVCDILHGNDLSSRLQSTLRAYLASQRGQQPLNEVKLIVIGRGSVGKTSIVNALQGRPFRRGETETPGIGIGIWRLLCEQTEIKVHIWDFAGQEITHEAHRFFLTARCIYLVITDGRHGLQDSDVDHWLAHVEQFGTSSEDGNTHEISPAIVVANQVESSSCALESRRLKREHLCIHRFIETDCETGLGIEDLKQALRDVIASKQMDSVRQPFPTEWQRMKERLENWKQLKRHYYTFPEFELECQREGVRQGDQLALTHVLNHLGIALYYGQNPKLRDTRVLDPQWLVNGMYALIRAIEKHGDRRWPGEMREDETSERLEQGLSLINESLALSDYPEQARGFLLELMEDRELCFVARETADGVPIYLLPSLLPKDEPDGIDLNDYLAAKPDQVRFRFRYKLLPDGLIPRFIVRTHSLSKNRLSRWRRGVILRWMGAQEEGIEPAQALVLADLKENKVEVAVQGGTEQLRQELSGIVRTHLKNIHLELLAAIGPEEELELSPDASQWQAVETLELAAQQRKQVQVRVLKKLIDLPPEKELEKLEPETAWQVNAAESALRVFISYSYKDHKRLESLTTTYLAVLENEKLIRKWTDGEIRAGESWDKRIREEMYSADIVILLLSEDFFASQYIQGVEMKLARERYREGHAEILPIWLSGETWRQHSWLENLQIMPRKKNSKLVPLLDFQPRQASGWEAVQEQLRKVILELRVKRGG